MVNEEKENALLTLALTPAYFALGFLMLWPNAWAIETVFQELLPWVQISWNQTLYVAAALSALQMLFPYKSIVEINEVGPFARLFVAVGVRLFLVCLAIVDVKITAFLLGAFGVSAS